MSDSNAHGPKEVMPQVTHQVTPQEDFSLAPLADAPAVVDVLIVGGGIIGNALASALAAPGRSVAVLESNPTWCKRLAGELLHPAGVDVLRELGVLDALRDAGALPVRGFAVYPVPDDGQETVLYYAEIGDGQKVGLGVEHETLVNTLRHEVSQREGVCLISGKVRDVIRENGRVVGVVASDKGGNERELRATLVVGADGRQSTIRKLLGLDPNPTLVSYSAGAIVADSALPHAGMGHILLGAWGPILAYPMGNAMARLIFDLPPDFSDGRRDRLAAHLREHYLPHLPSPLAEAVDAALEQPDTLQLTPNYRAQATSCWAPGAVLVGDATGCMHPMTASGMTNGLNDVRLLVPLVEEYLSQPHSDRPLRRYDARRRPFFQTRALLAKALHDVFRSPSPGARALRRGVFERWRSHRTFRLRTMGLLAGLESNPFVFAMQYLSVVHLAARRARKGPEAPLETWMDIGRQSVAHLDRGTISDLLLLSADGPLRRLPRRAA